MPRSTYYYYLKQLNKKDKYKEIKEQITSIYHENKGRYGYRRITMELHNRGYIINHKTVLKLMKQLGLQCFVRVRKYKSYKGEVGKICDNLLKRNFKADKPNQKWVTDVTEFSLFGTKLYLSPIIDLFNGEIVSYNISERPVFHQVANMLEKAFTKIPDNTNLILHSDQGWQYQMKQYQYILQKKGIRQSMSRKGNCLDNSCAENFFGLLKSELFYVKEYTSIEELETRLRGRHTETEEARKEMVSALTYPTIVFVFTLAVVTFVMMYVVPEFIDIYNSMDLASKQIKTMFMHI